MKVKLLTVYSGTKPFLEVEDVRCVQLSPKEQGEGKGIAWFRPSLYPNEDIGMYISLHKLPTIITIEKDGTMWIGESCFGKPIWIKRESDEK